jgi:hypothetical protein
MSCLTIDVGLLNLAMCCASRMDSLYKIHFWELLNVLDSESFICKEIQKNGKVCNRNAMYKNDNSHFCKRHFQDKPNRKNTITKKKVKDYLLQDIATKIIENVQSLYDKYKSDFHENIKHILIELQPKVNNKMKFASHVIYGKLVDLINQNNLDIKVRFIAAKNKLKYYKGPPLPIVKNTYSNRKKASILMVNWYLDNSIIDKVHWKELLENCSKKDDLCDTLLYAINYFTFEKIGKK